MKPAFGFILKKRKDGGLRFFYAHENNTLLEGSKRVCSKDYLAQLKDFPSDTDVIETCSRKRVNTKWKFYRLTNLKVFTASLKAVPMACKNAVLYEIPLKNCIINSLLYAEDKRQPLDVNLCLFHAFSLNLHGNQRLSEEISEPFISFRNILDVLSPNQFKRVHTNDIPVNDYLLTLNTLLYDIDLVDGNIIGGTHRQRVLNYGKTVEILRYNNHICSVSNKIAVFQSFRCPTCDNFCQRTLNFERNLTKCCELMKNVYCRNTYQIPETLFYKLDSLGNK